MNMKTLALLALCFPLMAHAANWVKVKTPATHEDYYIDKASVLKADRGFKVWSMVSSSTGQASPQGAPYKSVKALHVFTCEDRTTTLLQQVFYAEPMGKGHVVESLKFEKFSAEDIIPDSGADGALKIVCKPANP
jgi:hypothetical protein